MVPSPYRRHSVDHPSVTEVFPDDRRRFLVVSGTRSRTGEKWTLVLESQDDYWISRRELAGIFPADASVSGYLFDREGTRDPIELLRRMNELVRGEYYRILQDKMSGDRERSWLTSEVRRLKARIDALHRPSARRGKASSPRRRRST